MKSDVFCFDIKGDILVEGGRFGTQGACRNFRIMN